LLPRYSKMSKTNNRSKPVKHIEDTEYREIITSSLNHDTANLRSLKAGYEDLLEETGKEEYREIVEDAEQRIEALEQKFEDFRTGYTANFSTIIGDSMQALRPKLHSKDKDVIIDWDYNNQRGDSHDFLVDRMVYNLLDNSIEHGNGDIQIQITDTEDYLEIKVDDGGGLEQEDWDQILCNQDSKESYPSTGSYIIDQAAQKNNIQITCSDDHDYNIKIPF